MMPNGVNNGGSEWSSEAFRSTMVKKLEEALRDLKGNVSHAAALEAERKAFSEASNRIEYLSSISKIILAVKNRTQQQQQMQQQQQQQQQGGFVEDPGSSNSLGGGGQRAPLTLQQQQQIQMLQQQQQMRPNVMNSGGAVSQLQARLTQRMPNPQMGNMGHRPNMMTQQMVPQGNPRMGGASQMGPVSTPMMSSGGGIITQQQQRGPPPMYMNANTSSSGNTLPPGGSPMMVTHSPSGGQSQVQQQQVTGQQQQQSSQFIQSPMNQQQGGMGSSMPSPVNNAAAAGNPRGLAPSPMSTSVVTPHNEPPGSVEDHQYLEKVRELGKYIEPLQRMIAKIGNEDQVKLSKMKRLMDILSNPNKRLPIETLLKCETVLKRIIVDDNIEQDGGAPSGGTNTGDMFTSANINPLLEAVLKLHKQLQQPNGNTAYVPLNHSLQRTLGAPLETMYGPDIGPPVYTKKRKLSKHSETEEGIPDVLQGEIARLQPHFKVNLDPTEASSGAPPLKLICQLDDQDLPPVPAISVTIPKNYPRSSSPRLFTNPYSNEYEITPFFKMVEDALKERLLRMAPNHTLTQLLNAWEMSVRASCSPNALSTIQQTTKHSVILGL